jgi:nucleotide-binding universal stress UspA family protein
MSAEPPPDAKRAHHPDGSSSERRIVVGVDASEGASAALRWAIDEARLRGTRLRAVYAWTLTYPPGEGYGYILGPPAGAAHDGMSDQRRAAEQVLERAAARLRTEAAGLDFERHVIEGPAAEVLVDASAHADLLVVGSRGHGGFASLLLGSVSQHCAHHASCPVVIVPPAARPGPDAERAHTGAAA